MSNGQKPKINKKYVPSVTTTQHIVRQEFNYSRGTINLNFTLRTDQPNELEEFKALMVQGIEDIDKVLATFK